MNERAIQLTARLTLRLARLQCASAVCDSWAEVVPGARIEAFRARMLCARYVRALRRVARLRSPGRDSNTR